MVGPIEVRVSVDLEKLQQDLNQAYDRARLTNKNVSVIYEVRVGTHIIRGEIRVAPDGTVGDVIWPDSLPSE